MIAPEIPKPKKPLLRVSGGTPAGYPDFVPLNPWGRGFPKPEREPKPALYQVVVLDRRNGNQETRVGPKMQHEFAAMFCDAIEKQIKSGAEKQWTDPIVLKMTEGAL